MGADAFGLTRCNAHHRGFWPQQLAAKPRQHARIGRTGSGERKRIAEGPSFNSCTVALYGPTALVTHDPQEKFLPFTFRPETRPTMRTLALCRLSHIAPYEAKQIHGAVWFGHIVVAAGGTRLFLVPLHSEGTHGNDRDRGKGSSLICRVAS